MTEMMKLAEKDIKRGIVNVVHVFRKYEGDEKRNRCLKKDTIQEMKLKTQ